MMTIREILSEYRAGFYRSVRSESAAAAAEKQGTALLVS